MSVISIIKRKFLGEYYPHKLLYLHIPKTGGTYLGQYESSGQPVVSSVYSLNHKYIISDAGIGNPIYAYHDPENYTKEVLLYKKIKRYFILSTIRNHFDWLVSYYGHAGGISPKYRNPDHYDYKNAQKGFDYLVQTIANRDDIWPNRKFIFFQLFSSNGQLVVDWLNRTKTLDQDLEQLAVAQGLSYEKKPKQRVAHRKKYHHYYTDMLIELVNITWKREIRLYGFDFEKDIPNPELHHEVSVSKKRQIKYCWESDKLLIDNNNSNH